MAEQERSPDPSMARSFPTEELGHLPFQAVSSPFGTRRRFRSAEEDAAATAALAIRQAELSQRLHLALQNAASKSAESMDALRLAVSQFTVALRDQGTTPEAVLIKLKAAIHAQTLSPTRHISRWSGPELHESLSTWCIEEYFKEALTEAKPSRTGRTPHVAIQLREQPTTFWRFWLRAAFTGRSR